MVERIREDNPDAAQRVAQTIYNAVAALRVSPKRGRSGLVSDTRELVFAPLPYIAVYEIINGNVQVLRVRHLAGLALNPARSGFRLAPQFHVR
jgi:plasmid stabilization system protein ParE